MNNEDYTEAYNIFKYQLDCVVNDDRQNQVKLYDEQLHYEFPFAQDRPKIILGRDEFIKVMEPIWEKRRTNGINLFLGKIEFHSTNEPNLYLAVFELIASMENTKKIFSSQCVQIIKIKDQKIIEVREYFEP
jgi:hypothetical protein